MNTISDAPLRPDRQGRAPLEALLTLAEHVEGILKVADGLFLARRVVRLDGLEQHVGRICASALDLPVEHGREARTRLILLVAELDRVRGHLMPR